MEGKRIAAQTLVQAAVVALVVLAVLLVLRGAEVFLVAFGGILLAILFQGSARWLQEKLGISNGWALLVTILGPLALLVSAAWLAAPDVASQASELADRVPKAVQHLQSRLRELDWADRILEQGQRIENALPDGSAAATIATGFFSSTLGGLGNLLFALAIGLFVSVNPGLYLRGLLRLVPPTRRDRAEEVLRTTGSTLASWLVAKMIAMLVIGVLTTAGLWLIGIDLPLVLGLIAALLSFIPNVGPVIAIVPAALIAVIDGIEPLLYVVALYASIQTIESYALTPLLQREMVELPPALTIAMQVLLGVLAGVMGVIVAAPLTAAAMVMTKMWYVEDLLGDRIRPH
ncbi:MAG: AI-2E family transporter [Burkholderiaceae bacterium]|nr:AI-2E family transporter [Burkholderiaceae bacterium]